MKRRPVVFNEKDPHQKRLLEHSNKYTNFSAYIKSLIQRDMDGAWNHPVVPAYEIPPEITKEVVEGFI